MTRVTATIGTPMSAAGAQGVPGQHPEAAAVGRDIVLHRDLHGEIGDARFVKEFVNHCKSSAGCLGSVRGPGNSGSYFR